METNIHPTDQHGNSHDRQLSFNFFTGREPVQGLRGNSLPRTPGCEGQTVHHHSHNGSHIQRLFPMAERRSGLLSAFMPPPALVREGKHHAASSTFSASDLKFVTVSPNHRVGSLYTKDGRFRLCHPNGPKVKHSGSASIRRHRINEDDYRVVKKKEAVYEKRTHKRLNTAKKIDALKKASSLEPLDENNIEAARGNKLVEFIDTGKGISVHCSSGNIQPAPHRLRQCRIKNAVKDVSRGRNVYWGYSQERSMHP